jgi:hypothetical protein
LCDCIAYLGRIIQWCCEHDYWREHHGGNGVVTDSERRWTEPEVLEPDFTDGGDYDAELHAALLPFEAEAGGAVGGSTTGFGVPGAGG